MRTLKIVSLTAFLGFLYQSIRNTNWYFITLAYIFFIIYILCVLFLWALRGGIYTDDDFIIYDFKTKKFNYHNFQPPKINLSLKRKIISILEFLFF